MSTASIRPRILITLTMLVTILAVSACSSSGSPAKKPAGASPPSSDDSGGRAPADASTAAAVTHAYQTFFSSASTSAESEAVLQNGSHFASALKSQGTSSYAAKSSATVQAVRTTSSADVVAVTFTVLSNGQTLLPGDQGFAVRVDGTWQVAAQTFCGLVALEGDAPKACADSTLTALPH